MTVICTYCDRQSDQLVEVDGTPMCPECVEKETAKCARCGDIMLKEFLFEVEIFDSYRCDICYYSVEIELLYLAAMRLKNNDKTTGK